MPEDGCEERKACVHVRAPSMAAIFDCFRSLTAFWQGTTGSVAAGPMPAQSCRHAACRTFGTDATANQPFSGCFVPGHPRLLIAERRGITRRGKILHRARTVSIIHLLGFSIDIPLQGFNSMGVLLHVTISSEGLLPHHKQCTCPTRLLIVATSNTAD